MSGDGVGGIAEFRVTTAGIQGEARMEVREKLTLELLTRRDTTRLGTWLGMGAQGGDLVVLSGDLGAGKTFLARAMARSLGVPVDVRVTSPTFTLVHHFPTTPPLLHADLYRIGDPSEVDQLILREARADNAILMVEWGEPYLRELGGDALIVRLDLSSRGRTARLASTGPRSLRWLSRPLPGKLMVRARSKPE